MLNELNVLWMLLFAVTPAVAQVSVGIGLPNVSIGINLPLYPELVPIPGYPVYYAPRLNSNYFFYDGMYWVYQGDGWYSSSWYNGPWWLVSPDAVPLYVLRVPVRYYRQPPAFFLGWQLSAPPRWGDHWGNDWAQRRSGWDRWNRGSAPAAAPLPAYQRNYSGNRYPRVEQQPALQSKNYRYQPQDPVVRQQHQAQRQQSGPAMPAQAAPRRGTQGVSQERTPAPQTVQRANPPPPVQQNAPAAPRAQPPQRVSEPAERAAQTQAPQQKRTPPVQQQNQQPQNDAAQHQQPESRSHNEAAAPQGRAAAPEPGRGSDQERGREKADERGQDRRN